MCAMHETLYAFKLLFLFFGVGVEGEGWGEVLGCCNHAYMLCDAVHC